MHQIPLAEAGFNAGHIHEWRLSPPPNTFDSLTADDRPASYNQEKHFSAAVSARKEHVAENYWIGLSFKIPGRLNLPALENALLMFVKRHEVLRCGFEQLIAGDLRCDVMTPEEVRLVHTDLGPFSSAAEVTTHIRTTFNRDIDTLSWPLFLMGVVIEPTQSTVYMGFDHILCDGLSLVIAVEEVQRDYAALAAGEPLDLAERGSYLDFGDAQRHRYATLAANSPDLEYWRSFISDAGDLFPRIPLDLGLEYGHMYPARNHTVRLLDDASALEFERICRQHGTKLFMGLLAVVGMSLRDISGCQKYHGFLPVSERQDPRWQKSFGWFVNTLAITFPIADGMSFPQVVEGVQSGFKELIRNVDVPFVKVWELLAPQYFHLRTWPYPVNFFSFLDYRKLPGADQFGVWQSKTIPNTSHSNTANMWFLRNADGLYLNSIFCDVPKSVDAMDRYRAAIASTLEGLISASTRENAVARERAQSTVAV
ncbi:condensation domain-containing protein [Myxococcus sp. K15C18031901]|uniref:condensation domain-containing protein n=1 Tax=Myxococcus dinghuensis TaxID=2906761 RepID=UPI0020A7A1CF|nr:condensation domain-containing protein [Myxococcus dinghuensis]MCP3097828.1 condensation domain-containing protein [Myxococcus dinghuensis]